MLVRTNKYRVTCQLYHVPSACTCKCLFSGSFVINLLNFHELSEVLPRALATPKTGLLFFFFTILPSDAAQWFPSLFAEVPHLEGLKVEIYNRFGLALVFSHQLQLSYCPPYPAQTSQLSLSLMLSCSPSVMSLSQLLAQAQWHWHWANRFGWISVFLSTIIHVSSSKPGRVLSQSSSKCLVSWIWKALI